MKLPTGIRGLGGGSVFSGSGLTEIDLSSYTQLTTIVGGTFENAASLTTVTLPSKITKIDTRAFSNSGITAINLSKTALTTIDNGAFANTTNLKSLTVPNTLTTINSDDTSTGTAIVSTFSGSGITSLDLSNTTISTIKASTFNGAASLTEVKLPSTVTRIEQNAFKGDAALTTLSQADPATGSGNAQVRADEAATGTATFGSKLISIGNNAFQGTGFSIVDLSAATGTSASGGSPSAPATPLSVGSNAFTNMAELTTVKLPKDSNINPAYFGNPTPAEGAEPKLKTITYGTDNTTPATFKGDGSTFSGTNYNKISNETIDLTGYTNLTTLGAGVLFDNTAMTTLKMNAPIMSLSGANVSVADPV